MSELPANNEESYNVDELDEYQAVSMHAVWAFLLGLASPLAFLSPVLLVIPILGIVVTMMAISKLRDGGQSLKGHRLVRLGLILTLFFGVATCSRIAVINLLVNRARAASEAETSKAETKVEESDLMGPDNRKGS